MNEVCVDPSSKQLETRIAWKTHCFLSQLIRGDYEKELSVLNEPTGQAQFFISCNLQEPLDSLTQLVIRATFENTKKEFQATLLEKKLSICLLKIEPLFSGPTCSAVVILRIMK